MSPKKSQYLASAVIVLQLTILSAGIAHGDIIILADPDPTGRPLPIVINPAMRGIIFTEPAKDNPGVARRQFSRAHNWSAYKNNAPIVSGYYPYAYDPNAPLEIRNRTMVDYSLRRAQGYRQEANK